MARADEYTPSTVSEPGVDPLIARLTPRAVTVAMENSELKVSAALRNVFASRESERYDPVVSEVRLSLADNGATGRLQSVLSLWGNPFSLLGIRGRDALRAVNRRHDCSALVNGQAACNRRRAAAVWSVMNSGATPAVSVSIGVDMYADAFGYSRGDRRRMWGGWRQQLAAEWRIRERGRISAWYSFGEILAEAPPIEEGGDVASASDRAVAAEPSLFVGGGASGSVLFKTKRPMESQFLSDDYVKSGFIAGYALGLSVQAVHWEDAVTAPAHELDLSGTVSLDVRESSNLQVQLAVSWVGYVPRDGGDWTCKWVPTISVTGAISGR
jgi:hypothetical protein